MPLFVIIGRDRPDGLETRLATREAHLAFVRERAGQVRLGGPFLDAAGLMIGSMLIIEAADLADARAFVAADPYRAAGLFQSVTVEPWRLTVGGFAG